MTEHLDHSEADLNCFLDYLRIKSPVRQTNMIHVTLEEVLERHKKKLMDKEIRIVKKQFEKDLPDAGVHVDELRFILNWVLEYAIISAIPNRSLGRLPAEVIAREFVLSVVGFGLALALFQWVWRIGLKRFWEVGA